jgi:hypothetical protein
MTHIQVHRSSIAGATPNTETMFEGEIAVNLTDKKLFVKGATGELITLAAPQTHGDTDHVTSVNGLTGAVTLKPSGFEFEILSTSLSDVNTDIPSSGGIRLVRDYIGTTQITFNRYDKQGNDLLYPHVNLLNNGGTIYAVSEDGEKFFHILSPDRQTRTGHSFSLLPNNSVSASKFQFQDTTRIPNDGSPDDGLIAMENFSVGDKVFVHFIPNVAPPTTVGGISGEIFLSSELSLSGASGNTLGISIDNLAVISSFNGATGSVQGVSTFNGSTGTVQGVSTFNGATGTVQGVSTFNGATGTIDTTSLVLPVTGISGAAGITFSDGTFLSSEGQIAFKNEANNFSQNNTFTTTKGLGSNGDGEVALKFTDNYIVDIGDPDADSSGWFAQVNGSSETFKLESAAGIEYEFDITAFDAKSNLIKTTSRVECAGISGPSGITFSDGTFQKSAARNGFRYEASSYMTGNGKIAIFIDQSSSESDQIQVATTDADGNNLLTLYQELMNNGGFISVTKGDSTYILATTVRSDPTYDGSFGTTEEEQSITTPGSTTYYTLQTVFDYDLDGDLNSGDVYVQIIPNHENRVAAFNGSTGAIIFRKTDVATFTIDASSAIATGAKTKSLYRVPHDGTLTNFDVKTSATGGFTACVKIAGSDFANPTTGSVTGCSLGVTGFTGSSTVFNQSTVTGGQFLYLDVFSNVSGSSAAQAFLTFESR